VLVPLVCCCRPNTYSHTHPAALLITIGPSNTPSTALLSCRTDNAVKNRWHSTLKRQAEKEQAEEREKQRLAAMLIASNPALAAQLHLPSSAVAAAAAAAAAGQQQAPAAAAALTAQHSLPMGAAGALSGGELAALQQQRPLQQQQQQIPLQQQQQQQQQPQLLVHPTAAQQQQQQQGQVTREWQDERERQLVAALYAKGHTAMAVQLHNQLQANQHLPPEQRVGLLIALLNAGGYSELAALLQDQAARQRQQQQQSVAAGTAPVRSGSQHLDVSMQQAGAAAGGPSSSGLSQHQQQQQQGLMPNLMLTSAGFPAASLQQQQQQQQLQFLKQEDDPQHRSRAGGASSSSRGSLQQQQPRQLDPSDSPTQVRHTESPVQLFWVCISCTAAAASISAWRETARVFCWGVLFARLIQLCDSNARLSKTSHQLCHKQRVP
jgi:hypothetical protein